MIEKLEQYKQADGYYDIHAIKNDEEPEADSLDLTFSAWFGGEDDPDRPDEPEESELVRLARELNEQHAAEIEKANEQEITELANELETAQSQRRNQIFNRLVELGAGQIIGDADSLEFVWNEWHGTEYDDQVGIEETGGWGGYRPGAGRPPEDYKRQLLSVRCSDEELNRIQSTLDTRQRAEILLDATKGGEQDA